MKFGNYLLTIVFLLFLILISGISVYLPDKEISKLENRFLAQMPEIRMDKIISGEWTKNFETYFADQFVLRDEWVELYTKWEMLMGKTFVNGYHVTDDYWIMAQPSNSFPQKELDDSAKMLNELGEILKEKGSKLYYFPMPAKVFEMADVLPSFVPKGRGKENTEYLLSNLNENVVTGINVSKELNENFSKKEISKMYFKTDHHWNMRGAFFGYQTLIQVIGEDFPIHKDLMKKENYTFYCEKEKTIIGSWNRNLHMLVPANEDYPCYYQPNKFSFDDMVIYKGEMKKQNLFPFNEYYAIGLRKNEAFIEYHDAYANNYAELNILNKNEKNGLNVLLIKDSYANPIIPHIALHFTKTTVFDPRYDKKRSVLDLINNREFDLVIILYNSNNLKGSMYLFDQPAK